MPRERSPTRATRRVTTRRARRRARKSWRRPNGTPGLKIIQPRSIATTVKGCGINCKYVLFSASALPLWGTMDSLSKTSAAHEGSPKWRTQFYPPGTKPEDVGLPPLPTAITCATPPPIVRDSEELALP